MTKHTFELKLVMQALANLPVRERHIFIERNFTYEPTTYKKLGERWGVSGNYARTLYFRASRKTYFHCYHLKKGNEVMLKRLQHFQHKTPSQWCRFEILDHPNPNWRTEHEST